MNNEYNIMIQKIRFKLTDRYLVLLICFLGYISTVSAQSHKISGVVVDEGKSPIIGATIQVKGANNGTITDIDGNFSLEVINPKAQLQISYIGFTSITVPVQLKVKMTITMQEASRNLDEVVVIGFGTVRKSDLSGSVSAVSMKNEAEIMPITSADQFLQGRIAGVSIAANSGAPGAGMNIQIRGVSTLSGNTDPLYVVDGFPIESATASVNGGTSELSQQPAMNPLASINPNDIESIQVLKDASATAIYGSRAANGVIVIKTKAPSEGQLRVNYNFTASIAIPDLYGYDLLDAREKLDFEKSIGMYKDNNADAQINKDKDYNYKLSLVESGVNTYWLSQPLKVEFIQKHSIFIEGGDKAVRYGIDFKYDKDNGVMKGSARDRGALGFSLSYNLKDKLLVRNYLTVNKVKSKESPYGDFSQYALLNPYYPFQDEHGYLIR